MVSCLPTWNRNHNILIAGLAVGYWKTKDDVLNNWAIDNEFKPEMCPQKAQELIDGWKKAVRCSFGWAKD